LQSLKKSDSFLASRRRTREEQIYHIDSKDVDLLAGRWQRYLTAECIVLTSLESNIDAVEAMPTRCRRGRSLNGRWKKFGGYQKQRTDKIERVCVLFTDRDAKYTVQNTFLLYHAPFGSYSRLFIVHNGGISILAVVGALDRKQRHHSFLQPDFVYVGR
jgi:hypothetical protein